LAFKLIALMLLGATISSVPLVQAKAEAKPPVEVLTGIRLVNVEKVDLASNTYRLDFYLWFSWTPGEINMTQVQAFEFLNGSPSKDVVFATEAEGFLEYRVKGDFVKTFDFSRYPFESHALVVTIEHKNMNSTALVYTVDKDSSLDSGVNVVGWDLLSFDTYVVEHEFSGNSFSNFVFDLRVGRPFFSSLVKNVLPITVIVVISLLTFFMAPQNFGQRIGLAVSTLMAASAFHLSLLSGLPPTGYLTLADRMMLIVYIIFLFNLAVSVYIMRLVDAKRNDDAAKFNGKAAKILVVLAVALIAVQLFI
jgi:hypothetical protein